MSISAAELPEMAARAAGPRARTPIFARDSRPASDGSPFSLCRRLQRSWRSVTSWSAGCSRAGDSGERRRLSPGGFRRIGRRTARGTLGRRYSSTFYALTTRGRRAVATARVALTAALGTSWRSAAADARGRCRWGRAVLTASAGLAAWIEFALLRHSLRRRIARQVCRCAWQRRLGRRRRVRRRRVRLSRCYSRDAERC